MIRALTFLTTTARSVRGKEERGSSAVEAVVILPFLFLIFFTIIQGTMVLQAGNAAQSVASAAYNAARLYGASDGDGVAAGNALLGDLESTLTNAQVVVERNGQTVTVTVTGQAASLVPGVPLDVERTVYGPTERWVE